MTSRKYFYEEDGKIKKYCYCSLCGKGPFTQKQIANDPRPDMIRDVAGQNSKIYYCYSCDRFTNIVKVVKDNSASTSPKNQKIIEEEIEELPTVKAQSDIMQQSVQPAEILPDVQQQDEKWFVILVKNTKGQYFCKHTTNVNQLLNDINLNIVKIPNYPCELVYKKLVLNESEATKFSDLIKKRPRQYKEQLITKYLENLED